MRYKTATILILLGTTNVTAQTAKVSDMSANLVKEGREGIYLFLPSVSDQASSRRIAGNVTVFKDGGNKKYRQVGVFRNASTLQEFERIVGKNVIQYLRGFKKLNSDEAVWNYLRVHNNINEYGLLATNISFLQAMGKCFVDKEAAAVPPGTVLRYRISLFGSTSPDSMMELSIATGKKPAITAPRLKRVVEDDSVLVVEWTSPVQGNADATNGEIWLKTGNLGTYQLAGYALALKNEQQTAITYTWREKVKPGMQYYFYLLPVTFTGLPGPASDIASAISRNFKLLAQTASMNAIDTVNGIYLSWLPLPDADLSAGIVIERSKEPQRGYQVLDTITVRAVSYTDTRVMPGNSYHYRIRLLTIRQQLSEPSAHASAIYRATGILPEAPEGIRTEASEKSIRISWRKSPYPEIAGYYVYRNSGDNPQWLRVSNLVKDTSFTDSSTLVSRLSYGYAVTAVDYNQAESGYSERVSVAILQKQIPPAPAGMRGVSDEGRIMLAWNEMKQSDDQVAFYNIYRKETGASFRETAGELTPASLLRQGFVKLNIDAVPSATYTDTKDLNGKSFAYAVTAVDNFGIEGNAFGAIVINASVPRLLPPAQVSARKIKQGIEVSWDENLQQGIRGYIILRREPNNANAVQVGTVEKRKLSYTDSRITPGKLYFYSVKSTGNNIASENSVEKGVRF